jgi:hypothetical protein
LPPVLADAPGRQNGLARLACTKPLGDAVDEPQRLALLFAASQLALDGFVRSGGETGQEPAISPR